MHLRQSRESYVSMATQCFHVEAPAANITAQLVMALPTSDSATCVPKGRLPDEDSDQAVLKELVSNWLHIYPNDACCSSL